MLYFSLKSKIIAYIELKNNYISWNCFYKSFSWKFWSIRFKYYIQLERNVSWNVKILQKILSSLFICSCKFWNDMDIFIGKHSNVSIQSLYTSFNTQYRNHLWFFTFRNFTKRYRIYMSSKNVRFRISRKSWKLFYQCQTILYRN